MRRVIDDIVVREHTINTIDVFIALCDMFEEKYSGDKLEYQLSRMGIRTTGDLRAVIESYLQVNFKNGAICVRDFAQEENAADPGALSDSVAKTLILPTASVGMAIS